MKKSLTVYKQIKSASVKNNIDDEFSFVMPVSRDIHRFCKRNGYFLAEVKIKDVINFITSSGALASYDNNKMKAFQLIFLKNKPARLSSRPFFKVTDKKCARKLFGCNPYFKSNVG